ncbi:MAG: hypothetical protein R2877_01165 [Bdellovibrionota bacterium]
MVACIAATFTLFEFDQTFESAWNFVGQGLVPCLSLDGRDTPPQSAKGYLETLERQLAQFGGKIATVSGRFYAMDRDKRVGNAPRKLFELLVYDEGNKETTALSALANSYARNETDEFMFACRFTQ